MVQSGQQRMVFTGGAQEINWLSMVSFDALNSFSIRHEEPHKSSRPFDKDRDGLVPGGGGAMLIIESLESASARNAQIYGEILSYGFSSDGDHLTLPSGGGARRAMQATMKAANLEPTDIDYISAHATSTPLGDAAEASAIHAIFGESGPPVASTKGMTGHECWMAGASELIYACLMMRDGFLASNVNFEEQEEGAAKINVLEDNEHGAPDTIMSNSFGFGGTNASLILRRFAQ
jgi:3-oxoacyl-[acyl-carrier-protein] synthase I